MPGRIRVDSSQGVFDEGSNTTNLVAVVAFVKYLYLQNAITLTERLVLFR